MPTAHVAPDLSSGLTGSSSRGSAGSIASEHDGDETAAPQLDNNRQIDATATGPSASQAPSTVGGWRKWLRKATFGALSVGPSADERRDRDLRAAVDEGLSGTHSIVVLGGKGGSGKTTTAICVGSMFALLHHKVVAVDGNPDIGANLGDRIDPSAASSYRELLADTTIERYADLRTHLGSSSVSGLDVLRADRRIGDRKLLDAKTYLATVEQLRRFYTVLVTDSGTNVEHPVSKGPLGTADAAIIVVACTQDGAQATGKVMDWLAESRHRELLARSVVVLNDVTGRADRTTIRTILDVFARRVGAERVFVLPHDPHLASSGSIDVSRLRPATHRRILEIAAATTTNWPLTPRVPERRPNVTGRRSPRFAVAMVIALAVIGGLGWLARDGVGPLPRPTSSVVQQPGSDGVAAWMRANIAAGTRLIVDGAPPPDGYLSIAPARLDESWRQCSYLVTTKSGDAMPPDADLATMWPFTTPVAAFNGVQIRRILAQSSPDDIRRNHDTDRDDRLRAGQALQSNPGLSWSPGATQVLGRGELDQRAALVLAALASEVPVTVDAIGVVAPEGAAGTPARTVTITAADAASATAILHAVLPPLKPDRIDTDWYGSIRVHWPLSTTPVPSVE